MICIILFLVLSAGSGRGAFADVDVRGRILDYYPKADSPDKIKFQVMEVTGGTERANWIHRGKLLVLPMANERPTDIHLFDLADIRIESMGEGAQVTSVKVVQPHYKKIPLPLELTMSIETDKPVYIGNETIKMTIKAQNVGKNAASIPLPTAQQFDFAVSDSAGEELWRWSHDKMFIAMLQTMIFAVREQKTFAEEASLMEIFGRKPLPGVYYVEGYIATNPEYPVGKAKIVIK
jgi:hypothetical protein